MGGEGVQKLADFADKVLQKCGQGEEGVQKSENFADVLNGSPLRASIWPLIEELNAFHTIHK